MKYKLKYLNAKKIYGGAAEVLIDSKQNLPNQKLSVGRITNMTKKNFEALEFSPLVIIIMGHGKVTEKKFHINKNDKIIYLTPEKSLIIPKKTRDMFTEFIGNNYTIEKAKHMVSLLHDFKTTPYFANKITAPEYISVDHHSDSFIMSYHPIEVNPPNHDIEFFFENAEIDYTLKKLEAQLKMFGPTTEIEKSIKEHKSSTPKLNTSGDGLYMIGIKNGVLSILILYNEKQCTIKLSTLMQILSVDNDSLKHFIPLSCLTVQSSDNFSEDSPGPQPKNPPGPQPKNPQFGTNHFMPNITLGHASVPI